MNEILLDVRMAAFFWCVLIMMNYQLLIGIIGLWRCYSNYGFVQATKVLGYTQDLNI